MKLSARKIPGPKRLLIIGAGGLGREVLAWALDVQNANSSWSVAGFLDENPAALKHYTSGYKILGSPDEFAFKAADLFLCALGDPVGRLRVAKAMMQRGCRFATLIHPSAHVGPACRIGEGSILCPGTVLTTNVTLGEFVLLNVSATIGHDVVVGRGCTLNAHSDVTGRACLGEGVYLGSHAVVLPGAKVGDYATVGAGSVVLRSVAARTTVMGVPARKVAGFEEKPNRSSWQSRTE